MGTTRILCAEWGADSQAVISQALAAAGYEVVAAETAAEASRLAAAERFDLFVIADQLPDATGVDLCRQLRAFTPEAPILFLSLEAREVVQQQVSEAGAQAYLIKPFQPWKLAQIVWVLLNQCGAEIDRG